jgi:putative CocE/NonD family hydrolase
MNEPPVKIFVMGKNEWRYEKEWPPLGVHYIKHYLHSDRAPNGLVGDGVLNTKRPGTEPPAVFEYDPDKPVPTRGGNGCCHSTRVPAIYLGVQDQREVESRHDVLVFTSPTLSEAVEVTGPIKIILYASSSNVDTDFVAKLVDVHPDGYARNLCDGIIRGRYRNSMVTPEPLEPGQVYKFQIDLGVTSNLFKAGHRIRIDIASSNFPRFDRNLNTGEPFGKTARLQKATNRIYHDAEHASHVVLPMIKKPE